MIRRLGTSMLPRTGRAARRHKRRQPGLEALEVRCVPALVTWTNPFGGQWSNPENWDVGRLPNAGDDVRIIDANVTFSFSGSTVTVRSLDCDGKLRITAGTLIVSDTSSIEDLEMTGGALASRNVLSITGDFAWKGGTLRGLTQSSSSQAIELRGVTTLTGSAVKTIDQLVVANYGVFNWAQGEVRTQRDGRFLNQTTGTFTSTSTTRFRPAVDNLGRWTVDSKATSEFDTFVNLGELTLKAGNLLAKTFVQSFGTTKLSGGSLVSGSTVVFSGGQVQGGGTIDGSVLNSGARFVPTPTGSLGQVLQIDGSYTQSGNATLAMMIDGVGTMTSDQLVVTKTATLGGMVELRLPAGAGVSGSTSEVYTIITADAIQGTFATGQVINPPQTSTFAVSSTATQVKVTQNSVAPQPAPPPGTGSGTTGDTTSGGTTSTNDATLANGAQVPRTAATPTGTVPTNGLPTGPQGLGPNLGRELGPGVVRGADVGTALLANAGLLGLSLTGSNRGAEWSTSSTMDGGANSFSGKMVVSSASMSGGEKGASSRFTESSGLSDEVFNQFRLTLPELEVPKESEELADDINQVLLGASSRSARADIVPQGGSQLSVVATLVAGDEGRAASESTEENPNTDLLPDLFLSPLTLRATLTQTAARKQTFPARLVVRVETIQDETEQSEGSNYVPVATVAGAVAVISALASALVGLTRVEPKSPSRSRPELRSP